MDPADLALGYILQLNERNYHIERGLRKCRFTIEPGMLASST
jgi:hypothetical protein